jgi:hypothetical protein
MRAKINIGNSPSSQGAPERNSCFFVAESQAEDLVCRLHGLLFQSRFDRYLQESARP